MTIQKSENTFVFRVRTIWYVIVELHHTRSRRLPLSSASSPPRHSIVCRLPRLASSAAACFPLRATTSPPPTSSLPPPPGPGLRGAANRRQEQREGKGGEKGEEAALTETTKRRARASYLILPFLRPLLTGVQVFIYLKYECFTPYHPRASARPPGGYHNNTA